MKLLMIDPNPTYETNDVTWVFAVDDDDPDYLKMTEYLTRLSEAGIIDDWRTDERVVTTASDMLEGLGHEYDSRLQDIEAGYDECQGGGGSDPVYESQMRDAGRGALLR